jgi:hypothetical protein
MYEHLSARERIRVIAGLDRMPAPPKYGGAAQPESSFAVDEMQLAVGEHGYDATVNAYYDALDAAAGIAGRAPESSARHLVMGEFEPLTVLVVPEGLVAAGGLARQAQPVSASV